MAVEDATLRFLSFLFWTLSAHSSAGRIEQASTPALAQSPNTKAEIM